MLTSIGIRVLLIIALLVSQLGVSFAPSTAADEIDDVVATIMQRQRIPGVALAVVRKGEVVKAQGYGFANLEHHVPVKPETIFQSGSVGKQFTSFAIMLLVEEGKLALDDPITKHLSPPPWAQPPSQTSPTGETPPVPELWKGITIRHLLTHTSGVGNVYATVNLRLDYTEDELVAAAARVKPDFAPGEKFAYSNTGYCLLGIIIHSASGRPYGEFVRERIFQPLGMATAQLISEADIVPNRAAGYQLVEGEIKNQDWVAQSFNSTGDGAIYLSILDMIKWDAGLRDRKLLRAESYAQMWTPGTLNDGTRTDYGFGWSIDETPGRRVLAHSGAWQGFTASISRCVDDDVTVIAFTNLAGGRAGRIVSEVAQRALAQEAATRPAPGN